MNFKIIGDSCCDLTPEYRANEHFTLVPLTLMIEDKNIIDDDTFNQAEFVRMVRESKECPKSACPSPESYLKEYESADGDVFVVTLSAELSGSYNSAVVAASMYKENGGANNIHVFNSCSASPGELLIALRAYNNAMSGMSFEENVADTEKYRDEMETYFVLETLDTLRKNGRLTQMQAIIASTLNIKPIMKATEIGTIEKVEQTRGFNKAIKRMVEILCEKIQNQEDKVMAIAHCNNMEAAMQVQELAKKMGNFKDYIITDMAGVATMYANDGGIIVSV